MLNLAVGATTSGSGHSSHGWPLVLFGAVVLLIGTLHAVKPDSSWRMSRWQYKNRAAMEPSAAGLTVIRLGGFVGIIAGIVFIVIGLTR